MPKYQNLDTCKAYFELLSLPKLDIAQALAENGPDRVKRYEVPLGGGLQYNYAAKAVGEAVLTKLEELATQQELIPKYQALLNGEIMNTGENRMVLHQLARGRLGADVQSEGRSLSEFYQQQNERVRAFAAAVQSGRILGSTGRPFDTVVQIGIGGSDLGPRALYLALDNWVRANGNTPKMRAEFISNVDPDDAAAVMNRVDPETTLFVLVSKSGTTQETLTNEEFVVKKLGSGDRALPAPRKHMVAVTSESSPLAKSDAYLDAFFIDDYIGGRYSATSPVGGVVLSLCFGSDVFAAVLAGAHEADRAALEPSPRANAAMLDALIGLYERNVLKLPATAVLPYSQALSRFPAHLQQLDMESNGKQVSRDGGAIAYETGPLVFGEPGTNGQHSFYQLLHQGTDIVPLQFVGFRESQLRDDLEFQGSTGQQKLNANLAAQIVAFACGKEDENPNKQFPGGRPSSLIHGARLSPEALGALLAHFENKVMFQGFLWNVNSFDQEGVQLGKVLTKQVLGGDMPEHLRAFADLLGAAPEDT